MDENCIGSSFEDFLEEEGILEECEYKIILERLKEQNKQNE